MSQRLSKYRLSPQMYYAHWPIYFRTFLQTFVPKIIYSYIDVNNTIGSLFTTSKQHMNSVLMLCVWDVFVYVRWGVGWGNGVWGGPIVEFSVISPFKGCLLASVMHAAIIPGSFCAMLSVSCTVCFYSCSVSTERRNRILILLR